MKLKFTWSSVTLKVHMVPLAIVDFLIDRLGFCSSWAHVKQQVQVALQHLNGKEVHLKGLGTLGILGLLFGLAVAEKEKAVGLCGAEVKGDGACLFSIPLVQNDERFGRLKCDGVQSGHVFTFEGHSPVDLHLGIALLCQPGQLESHIVVFVDNLHWNQKNKSYYSNSWKKDREEKTEKYADNVFCSIAVASAIWSVKE